MVRGLKTCQNSKNTFLKLNLEIWLVWMWFTLYWAAANAATIMGDIKRANLVFTDDDINDIVFILLSIFHSWTEIR